MSELTLDGALQRVCEMKTQLDSEALQVLRDNWEEVLSILLSELSGSEMLDPYDYSLQNPLFCSAVLLFGEQCETRAFEPLIECLIEEEGGNDNLFRAFSSQTLGAVLARCSGGARDRLLGVMRDATIDEFGRIAAFFALCQLSINGQWTKQECIEWIVRELEQITEASYFNSLLMVKALYFAPEATFDLANAYFGAYPEDELVFIFGEFLEQPPAFREEMRDLFFRPLQNADEEMKEILEDDSLFDKDDDFEESEFDHYMSNPLELLYILPSVKEDEGEVVATPNVGRNDPCPCGSGKKFKKCCVNKDYVSVPQMNYDWRGKPISDKNLFPSYLMQAGFLHKNVGNNAAALAAWCLFAELLRKITPPGIKNPLDIDAKGVFCGYEPVEAWILSFSHLVVTSLFEGEMTATHAGDTAFWLCDQFVNAPHYIREKLLAMRALLHMGHLDKEKEVIADLKQIIEWDPAHIMAVPMLAVFYQNSIKGPDLEAARQVLEEGIKHAKDEESRQGLQRQLENLGKEKGDG